MSKQVKTVEADVETIPPKPRTAPAQEWWDVYCFDDEVDAWEQSDGFSSEADARAEAQNLFGGHVCLVHYTLPAVTI